MCTNCVTDTGFETHADAVRDRVDSMMIQDWLTLGLASMVVAFAVFAEIRGCHTVRDRLARALSKRHEKSAAAGASPYAASLLRVTTFFSQT